MKWVDKRLLADMIEQSCLYGSILVAYDFDNTVSPWGDKDDPKVLERSRELIRRAKAQGHVVYCYTANPDEARVISVCKELNIPMDYLNEAPSKGASAHVPKGGAKCYYNIFLDDKCGLKSAQDTLEAFLITTENIIMTDEVEFDIKKMMECHRGRLRALRQCQVGTEAHKVLTKRIETFRKIAIAAHGILPEELEAFEAEALK